MDFKLIIGLIWPFVKEAIFGRDVDPDNAKTKRKKLAHRITDFFMGSHRATSALILFAAIAFFVSVISVKKLATIALSRENITQTAPVIDGKVRQHQKPDDQEQHHVVNEVDRVEQSRSFIIEQLSKSAH